MYHVGVLDLSISFPVHMIQLAQQLVQNSIHCCLYMPMYLKLNSFFTKSGLVSEVLSDIRLALLDNRSNLLLKFRDGKQCVITPNYQTKFYCISRLDLRLVS